MTQTIIIEVIKYLIPSALSFLVGLLITQYRKMNGLLIIVKWTSKRMLIEDCKCYLEKGYMTPTESAELDKLWEVYHKKLKLNSEGETYYKLAQKLPIRLEEHNDNKN